MDAAMKTALHLREYEDILNLEDIYSLLGKFYILIKNFFHVKLLFNIHYNSSLVLLLII